MRVHDLGRAELVDGLVQRFDAELASSVFEIRQGRTLWVCQSMIAMR